MERIDDSSTIFLVLGLACGIPLMLIALGAIWFFVFRASRSTAAKVAVSVVCGFAGVVVLLSGLVGVLISLSTTIAVKYGPPPTYFSSPAPLYGAPNTAVPYTEVPSEPATPIPVKYGPPPTEEPIQLMYGPPPTIEE